MADLSFTNNEFLSSNEDLPKETKYSYIPSIFTLVLSAGLFAGLYLGLPLLIGTVPVWIIPVACLASVVTILGGLSLIHYFRHRSQDSDSSSQHGKALSRSLSQASLLSCSSIGSCEDNDPNGLDHNSSSQHGKALSRSLSRDSFDSCQS